MYTIGAPSAIAMGGMLASTDRLGSLQKRDGHKMKKGMGDQDLVQKHDSWTFDFCLASDPELQTMSKAFSLLSCHAFSSNAA